MGYSPLLFPDDLAAGLQIIAAQGLARGQDAQGSVASASRQRGGDFPVNRSRSMLEHSSFNKGSRLMLKENNHRLRFLTDFEIEAQLKAYEDLKTYTPHLRPVVEMALLTGMRRGEMLSLTWEQIRNGFIYLTETKSGKARQIPINDRLAEVHKEVRRENQLKSSYVFCDSQERRFLEVKRSFASACRKAGIEAFRFHDLRHTFASQLVMRGASLKAVQELLGHASLAMTMR